MRLLVHVTGPTAPERYAFPISGAVAKLQLDARGTISVFDRPGRRSAMIAPAWARDAAGRKIPTHFEVNGTTVSQVVEHRGVGVSYPVVADPSVWKVAKCAFAIVFVVGTSIFAASKITKIRKAIRELGGVKDTARLLVGATSRVEKLRAVGAAMGSAASYFFGIDAIKSNC